MNRIAALSAALAVLAAAAGAEKGRAPAGLPPLARQLAARLAPGLPPAAPALVPAVTGAPTAAPLFWSRLVVPEGTWGGNHGSSIAELPDGELLVSWFAGEREGSADSQIYGARIRPGDAAHSAPTPWVFRGERPDGAFLADKAPGNSVLYVDDEGITWLFWAAKTIGGWSGAKINYKVSRDGGRSWSRAKRLVDEMGNLVRGVPLRLDSETFLLPAYKELWERKGYACTIKHRGGEILSSDCGGELPEEQAIQPTLARGEDGALLMLLRDRKGRGVQRAWSRDQGRSWSRLEPVGLPNPNSSVAATNLRDGRILLVYNHSASDRYPLSLALSEDGGRSFRRVADIETSEGEYSYPTVIQARDGRIHVTYTYHRRSIKHVVFDAAWLDAAAAAGR